MSDSPTDVPIEALVDAELKARAILGVPAGSPDDIRREIARQFDGGQPAPHSILPVVLSDTERATLDVLERSRTSPADVPSEALAEAERVVRELAARLRADNDVKYAFERGGEVIVGLDHLTDEEVVRLRADLDVSRAEAGRKGEAGG